jgi:hypothetical protein
VNDILRPVPIGALPGAVMPNKGTARIEWMLGVIEATHDAHPNTATTMIERQGPRFLVAPDGTAIRHLSHRVDGAGAVEMSVYTDRNPRDPLLTLSVQAHDWEAHPDLVPPPVTDDEESETSPGLAAARRFSAFFRAHLPALVVAIERSSQRLGEDARASTVRRRMQLAAYAISSETAGTVAVTAASPFGPMSACSSIPVEPDPCLTRLTAERVDAWSLEPVLCVGSFTTFGSHVIELRPMQATGNVSSMNPIELLRELQELPSA